MAPPPPPINLAIYRDFIFPASQIERLASVIAPKPKIPLPARSAPLEALNLSALFARRRRRLGFSFFAKRPNASYGTPTSPHGGIPAFLSSGAKLGGKSNLRFDFSLLAYYKE
jgi:hypothetical protein